MTMTTPPSDIDRLLAVPPCLDPKGAAVPRKQRAPAKGNAGRFDALNAFVDTELASLTGAEAAVWLVLYRDTRNGTARTAQSWIAKRAGVDGRTVRRALVALQRRGLVDVLRQGGPNAGAAIYRVRGTHSKGDSHAR